MKKLFAIAITGLLMTSCVSNKKFAEMEDKYQSTQDELKTAEMKLSACEDDKKSIRESYESQIKTLQNTNAALLNTQGEIVTISKKGAENLERSLESMKEKDLQIKTMRDAINKKDSVTLALVTSLKGALDNVNDEDIEINVEKGVVFVSISDKLLFGSGQFKVTEDAKKVLAKVAKVVNDKKDFEFMVEGHTDDDPISRTNIEDNWDLSTKRATAVVRILQNDYNVEPARMTAAGRGEYKPVASNDTSAGKAKNRRTRIVVLPKLDQFFGMIEDGMKDAK
ncbi:OmpA/MotB family protein [Psychroflexus montanilacus]|uniref:OmpA/MotB family protein n=1 Tax=Psychroflexus montanilacus TaxID=2873598 RepID=UPI001CCC1F42|nr:flagellar motor protein MotB [Psychroflexus montanilacus]MBZ9650604.1 flagellar motor protein MotB [Psychroflexus montanilacus]